MMLRSHLEVFQTPQIPHNQPELLAAAARFIPTKSDCGQLIIVADSWPLSKIPLKSFIDCSLAGSFRIHWVIYSLSDTHRFLSF